MDNAVFSADEQMQLHAQAHLTVWFFSCSPLLEKLISKMEQYGHNLDFFGGIELDVIFPLEFVSGMEDDTEYRLSVWRRARPP